MTRRPEQLALVSAEPAPSPHGFEPTAAQRAAIATRDRDVFSEAGAGSGKTGVLVERYCAASPTTVSTPTAILAFTFTERAAAELRHRVRRQLMARSRAAAERGDAASGPELARAARDRALLGHDDPRVLPAPARRASRSRRADPRFRVLDEAEAARLRERAVRRPRRRSPRAPRRSHGPLRRRLPPLPRLGDMVGRPPRAPAQPGNATRRGCRTGARPVHSAKATRRRPRSSRRPRRGAARGPRRPRGPARRIRRALRALKQERSGADFADLELQALELLRSSEPVADALAWPLRPPHGRRVPGHESRSARADRRPTWARDPALRGRRRAPVDLPVPPRRPRGLPASGGAAAAPTRRPDGCAPRQLPLACRSARRCRLPRARRCSTTFAPLEAGLEADGEPPAAARRPSSCSPTRAMTGAGKGGRPRHRAGAPPPGERAPRGRRGPRPRASACASSSTRARSTRGDMVVLLRAFTHVDAYEDALARSGLEPYVVGGRGYWSQQQVEDADPPARGGREPARRRDPLRRARLTGRAASAPTRSGSCARRGPRKPVWPARATSGRRSSAGDVAGATCRDRRRGAVWSASASVLARCARRRRWSRSRRSSTG